MLLCSIVIKSFRGVSDSQKVYFLGRPNFSEKKGMGIGRFRHREGEEDGQVKRSVYVSEAPLRVPPEEVPHFVTFCNHRGGVLFYLLLFTYHLGIHDIPQGHESREHDHQRALGRA